MKVKVFRTIEFEEIPNEAKKLISSAVADMNAMAVRSMESSSSVETILIEMEALRQSLIQIDFKLSDAESMLRGYLAKKYEEPPSES